MIFCLEAVDAAGNRYVVQSDELLSAFVELDKEIRRGG
jgi:hypothetical protein